MPERSAFGLPLELHLAAFISEITSPSFANNLATSSGAASPVRRKSRPEIVRHHGPARRCVISDLLQVPARCCCRSHLPSWNGLSSRHDRGLIPRKSMLDLSASGPAPRGSRDASTCRTPYECARRLKGTYWWCVARSSEVHFATFQGMLSSSSTDRVVGRLAAYPLSNCFN